jgi:3-oxoadipate enol-lactonase
MREHATVLFHQCNGDGDPLVLLNGIAMTTVSWQAVARPLAERFQVIRCDFRGQLMTPKAPPVDIADHADDVAALLDHLGLESAHLVGTSFGGVIATLTATRHPDRVRSLITIASADGFDEVMADEVARWREACVRSLEGGDRGHLSDVLQPVAYSASFLATHEADLAVRRAQVAALPDRWFHGLIGLLDTAHSLRLRDELAAVTCPTLVVAAELDGFVPLDRARGFAAAINGARFEVIAGAGHAVVVEQPKRVVELCMRFLRSLER